MSNLLQNPGLIDRNKTYDFEETRTIARATVERFNQSGNTITLQDADNSDGILTMDRTAEEPPRH